MQPAAAFVAAGCIKKNNGRKLRWYHPILHRDPCAETRKGNCRLRLGIRCDEHDPIYVDVP